MITCKHKILKGCGKFFRLLYILNLCSFHYGVLRRFSKCTSACTEVCAKEVESYITSEMMKLRKPYGNSLEKLGLWFYNEMQGKSSCPKLKWEINKRVITFNHQWKGNLKDRSLQQEVSVFLKCISLWMTKAMNCWEKEVVWKDGDDGCFNLFVGFTQMRSDKARRRVWSSESGDVSTISWLAELDNNFLPVDDINWVHCCTLPGCDR